MRSAIRVYDRMLNVLSVIVGIIILFTVFAVSFDVVSRYLFRSSVAWVFEVTEYALLYVPCLGMAWLAREGGHVAIDTFVGYLSKPMRRFLYLATTLASAAVCAVITYYAVVVVSQRYASGSTYEQILTVPEYWVLWVIPFGFGLTTFEFIRALLWPDTRPLRATEVVS